MRKLALIGTVLATAVDIAYLTVVSGQGAAPPNGLRVVFVAVFIGILALLSGLAALARWDQWAPLLLGVSATGMIFMGVLALWSIGVVLLVGAVPVLFAWLISLARRAKFSAYVQAAAGGILGIMIFIGGLLLTEIPTTCPPKGASSGSSAGIFGIRPYHYKCVDGTLTVLPGECNSTRGGVGADGKAYVTFSC